MQEVKSIGLISIYAGWKNNRPILLLKNHGQKGEMIEFLYLEPGKSSSISWKKLYLPLGSQQTVELPKNFKDWEKFGFLISGERLLAPISSLEKLLAKDNRALKVEPSQPEIEPSISKLERAEEAEYLTDKIQKPHIESPHVPELPSIDYRQEAKITVQQTNERVSELAHAYKDGEAIDFVNIRHYNSLMLKFRIDPRSEV